LLKEISDPPPVLFLKGNLTDFSLPMLAVVGTRKSTAYGRQVCEMLTGELALTGLVIVSGMARGIDSVAHQTTLAVGGKTVAVLGEGVDVVYPPENKELYEEIIKSGVVLSEMPPGHRPSRGTFPARNRIISGLSLGVLVIEGAEDSGALITASAALEQKREVFAVPGPITSPLSAGPTKLLKNGAKLVYRTEDVLEALNLNPKFRKQKLEQEVENKQDLSSEEKTILELLVNENLHIDEIIRKSGLASAQTGSLLSLMEIKSLVKNLGGGNYGRG
jgi:DNA processing protein